MAMEIKRAGKADLAAIATLMARSIRELQRGFLDDRQIAASFDIMGLDSQLIDDGTYFVVTDAAALIGCGGWSRRATLYGGDDAAVRDARLLDPATEPARIRAMYTAPGHARRGVGRLVLATCEAAASAEGFGRAELVATLSGEPLYRACGYTLVEAIVASTRGDAGIPVKRMAKDLGPV
ncbi:MAG: GNAT family N-acetyltransferase [Pseudomonadota bacterium]